jgi:HPt (histidine-containing phosphotransfer) domain-containing protein
MMAHQPGSPSPSPDLPRASPVLDIEAGVDRLMGNRAIYLRALARFRNDYRNAAGAIRTARDAGDASEARRLVHTLKGAAGMIEATALHAAAQALEDALRSGQRDAGNLLLGNLLHGTLLPRLEAALADVLRELDGMDLIAQTPPPPVPAPGNAVSDLRAMLDIGDGAALDLVEAARHELSGALGEREYAALSAAVADFDYEHALALLDRPGQAD